MNAELQSKYLKRRDHEKNLSVVGKIILNVAVTAQSV
jgi:hypothetical protein